MDKVSRYRQVVINILTTHSQIQPVYGGIEMQLLLDTTHDFPQERLRQRYQVLRAGWPKDRRVYGVLIQIDFVTLHLLRVLLVGKVQV